MPQINLFTFMKYYAFIWFLKTFKFTKFKSIPTLVILGQSALETAFWNKEKAAVYAENNNLFGMRLPKKRQTTATGENKAHATYNSPYDSIKDYFLRQEEFTSVKTSSVDEYMKTTVASKYAEDPSYLDKWPVYTEKVKAWFDAHKTQIFGVVILIVLAIWMLLRTISKKTK